MSLKEAAPGLYAALVERVTFWAHLEDYGVCTVFLQFVELIGHKAKL